MKALRILFLSVLSILVVSGIVYTASPPTPPAGMPAGGLFARYFSNIIGGNLGTGKCPPGQTIVGFNTGTTNIYGVPICEVTPKSKWIEDGINLYYPDGKVGIGMSNPTESLSVSGRIVADEYCIRGKNECVKTFQQAFSNTQYFNIENTSKSSDSAYYRYSKDDLLRQANGGFYIDVNETIVNKIGVDPSNPSQTLWFRIAGSYMQPYDPYPRSIFVEQGDNLSPITDATVAGPSGSNVMYCQKKRNSDGVVTYDNNCSANDVTWTITTTYLCDPSKNHGGMPQIQYKLLPGGDGCDANNYSSIFANSSWGNPETLNIRSTSYQSAPSDYNPDYCGWQNLHSQIVGRIVLGGYNQCSGQSILQFAKDSPRTIKIKSIGISLLK